MKQVKPKKIPNFRDLGGIPAADGRHVISGVLFRSGYHFHTKVKGRLTMTRRLGISRIIDLRCDEEVRDKPDARANAAYYHFPLLTSRLNPSVTAKTRLSVLKKNTAHEGGARGYLKECYETLVSSRLSRESMARTIRLLLEEKVPTLWHCTQGKDRAGFCSAVVLMALGVSREEIRRDYLLSNRSARVKNTLCCVGTTVATMRARYGRSLRLLLTARDEYLNTVYDEIDRLYGSVEKFLTEGLGLETSEITRLRDMYLA